MIEKLRNIITDYKIVPTSLKDIYQILVPYYDLDNDMFEIYLETREGGLILSDVGTTLMRLSYTYDYNTDKRRELLNQIIYSHGGELKGDIIWKHFDINSYKKDIADFLQILIKVSNMSLYSRQTVKDMFFEDLDFFVRENLFKYNPEKDFYPLGKSATQYKVDYKFNSLKTPIYMFGVNSSDKARLTTITCLQLITSNKKFQSLVIFKNIQEIPSSDQKRLLNAVDKVFTEFENNHEEINNYFRRKYEENSTF